LNISSPQPLNTKIYLIFEFLGGRLVGAQATLFSFKPVSKKCRNYVLYVFGGRFGVSQTGSEDGLFDGIFQQVKMHKQIGREDSIQAFCRRTRKLEGFLYEAAKNFNFF
jgi:hypothetical protein